MGVGLRLCLVGPLGCGLSLLLLVVRGLLLASLPGGEPAGGEAVLGAPELGQQRHGRPEGAARGRAGSVR